MTKRTVDVCLSVRGSAVVDIDVLLENLRKSDKHPWAKHLLAIYEDGGADALAQVYVKQAYVGGLDNLLRDWSLSAVTVEEHGGKAKFAPSRCTASVRPKKIRHLYPADVAVGGRYKFLNHVLACIRVCSFVQETVIHSVLTRATHSSGEGMRPTRLSW